VLVLEADAAVKVTVGRIGALDFARGYYAYVGSAFGPGGLAARIKHHLGSSARPRWHIDYLRTIATPIEVWHTTVGERLEHRWAAGLSRMDGFVPACRGFGASDCSCWTHLFYAARRPRVAAFRKIMISPCSIRTTGDLC
jgi:Uri superfamily endonuclease